MSYQIVDGSGDKIGEPIPNLEDVPEWENDLSRTPRQIARANDGYIEDVVTGSIVYEAP
ncbi:hypothetical protein SEA_NIKE_58 [Microbacterium phage Nike]|nr:hypothetical protein SEA_NIKE_58 [Microbacterium phage Nike]